MYRARQQTGINYAARCVSRVESGNDLGRFSAVIQIRTWNSTRKRKQLMCFVTFDDMVRAIEHIISCEQIVGPVNVLAPEPVSNKEFAKVLGKILDRPVFLKIPAFVLRIAMGEIAEAILAGDTLLKPEELMATGFRFQFPDIESALRHELSQ